MGIKLNKRILCTMLCFGVILIQSSSLVSAKEKTNKIVQEGKYSKRTVELIEDFPEFEKSLKKYTTGDLVSETETYIKIEPKENIDLQDSYTLDTITNDFNLKYYTREEFEIEKKQDIDNTISAYSLSRAQESTPSSWLSMTVQVYKGTGLSQYMVYNTAEWKSSPFFRFEDGIGIRLSNELTFSSDISTRTAYYKAGSVLHSYNKNLLVERGGPNLNTIMAKANLYNNNMGYKDETHKFMISSGVNFSSTTGTEGSVMGEYIHKEVSIGSVGINATTGGLSISLSASSDKCTATTSIVRQVVGSSPSGYPGYAVVKGSTGATVTKVQQRLNALGFTLNADGSFGPATDAAVRNFQKTRGISVDGSVGPTTWDYLFNKTFKPSYPGTAISYGSTGTIVLTVQARLNQLGYKLGAPDGSFGPATKNAVLNFQKSKGLSQDGYCGPATWAKLFP